VNVKVATRLFIGGLPWATTSDELRDMFAAVGTVVNATVMMDKMTGRSRGFGFVEMATEEEAKAAVEKLNGTEIAGRKIIVNEARPQAPREDRGGYGGGGGDRGGSRGGFRRDDRNGGDRGGNY
jgi:RNA recognition motif-containing protein